MRRGRPGSRSTARSRHRTLSTIGPFALRSEPRARPDPARGAGRLLRRPGRAAARRRPGPACLLAPSRRPPRRRRATPRASLALVPAEPSHRSRPVVPGRLSSPLPGPAGQPTCGTTASWWARRSSSSRTGRARRPACGPGVEPVPGPGGGAATPMEMAVAGAIFTARASSRTWRAAWGSHQTGRERGGHERGRRRPGHLRRLHEEQRPPREHPGPVPVRGHRLGDRTNGTAYVSVECG